MSHIYLNIQNFGFSIVPSLKKKDYRKKKRIDQMILSKQALVHYGQVLALQPHFLCIMIYVGNLLDINFKFKHSISQGSS